MLLPSQGGLLHVIGIGKVKIPVFSIIIPSSCMGREGMAPHITDFGITWNEW